MMTMKTVSARQANHEFSDLLSRVERGEEIVIARNNRPVARLTRFTSSPRVPGSLKGAIHVRDDFDSPLPPEVIAAFEGQ